jgi:hypothetical protein
MDFVNTFFQREWTAVSDDVLNRTIYWDRMLNVSVAKHAQLKAMLAVEVY